MPLVAGNLSVYKNSSCVITGAFFHTVQNLDSYLLDSEGFH